MAESVQAAMDRMVTPLRDFLDRGIFTESEIRSIVSRRRKSEYLLYRRTPRLNDYLTYIEDEVNLEKLRTLRHKRLLARRKRELQEQRKNNSTTQNAKKEHTWIQFSQHDTHIVRHVHLLYTRLLRRFGNDNASLYFQHAQFAKDVKSFSVLGRVYAEALRKHPRVIGLWIEAASHEFFGCPGEDDDDDEDDTKEKKGAGGRVGKGGTGGSVANARILMQRGLRVNPNSKELWRQYFSLEMHYVQKLRGRRKILQLEIGEDKKEEEEKDHVIPLVIYRNAIKAIPNDVSFRLSFMELCQSFPQTDDVEDEIMVSIEGDFDSSEDAWVARALYAADKKRREVGQKEGFLLEKNDADGVGQSRQRDLSSLDVLNEATDKLPTAKMFLLTFQFVRSRMRDMLEEAAANAAGEEDDDDEDDNNNNKDNDMATTLSPDVAQSITKHASFLDQTLKRVQSLSKEKVPNSSSDLVLELADYLLHSGEPKDAVHLLKRAVSVENKNKAVRIDGRIWIRWSDIVGRMEESSSPGCSNHGAAQGVLRKGLDFIEVNEPGHCMVLIELIRLLLDDYSREDNSLGKKKKKDNGGLSSLLQRLLLLFARDSSSPILHGTREKVGAAIVPELCLRYLQYSKNVGGINEARSSYNEVLFRSGYARSCEGMDDNEIDGMRSYFEACIEIEKSLMTMAKMNVIEKEDASKKVGRRSAASKKVKKKVVSTATAATKKDARNRLLRIYDMAIGFFREGGDDASALEYKKRQDEELVFS